MNIAMRKFAKETVKFLRSDSAKTILKLGCKKGKDAKYFSEKGYNVTAIGFSQSAIKELKRRSNKVNFIVAYKRS